MYTIQYDLSEAELEYDEICALSEKVSGGAVFVNLETKKIAAVVSDVIVKEDCFLLGIHFIDKNLEKMVDDDRLVAKFYQGIDPVSFLIQDHQ